MNEINQIYDRIMKRIFTLSNLSIINLINGLFSTNYPTNSKVSYPNKEFHNANMKKRMADVYIMINDVYTYHIEAQRQSDSLIVIRVFEYNFYYALGTLEEADRLRFPEPVVIYLTNQRDIPGQSILILDFGTQGTFEYQVTNFIYLDHNIVELNQKKMVVLIPFQLLRLQELIKKQASDENFAALQSLIQDDIIGSIKANLQVGNITQDDASQLLELTNLLYEQIYQHYEELGGQSDMKPLLEGAIELPFDKYRIRIDELEGEKTKAEQEKAKAEQEKTKAEQRITSLEEENQALKAQLEALQKSGN